MDFNNHFGAIDGWLGCPSCERPIDARALMADTKLRLLVELQQELEQKQLATPKVLAVIAGWESLQREISEAALENRPPVVTTANVARRRRARKP